MIFACCELGLKTVGRAPPAFCGFSPRVYKKTRGRKRKKTTTRGGAANGWEGARWINVARGVCAEGKRSKSRCFVNCGSRKRKKETVRGWEAVVDAMDGAGWEQVEGGSGGGSGARWRCSQADPKWPQWPRVSKDCSSAAQQGRAHMAGLDQGAHHRQGQVAGVRPEKAPCSQLPWARRTHKQLHTAR